MSRLSAEIESAFRSGALILTANSRAARWLRQEYALLMRRGGRQAWNTPPIEDWDTWVRQLWHNASLSDDEAPLLLTELQERQVWLRMQREDAYLLVSPDGMAQLAASAYGLLCSYEAHAERNRRWEQTDAGRFQQWAESFERECTRQKWLSQGCLEREIVGRIDDSSLPIPKDILLVGFDRFTPAQETLLDALRAQGIVVTKAAGQEATPARLLLADDPRDEITICAWWARRLLETAQSGMRIGVVVPDLGLVRSELERTFRRILMPESDDVSVLTATMPFEFSLGQPLANVPAIKAALLLLRWAIAPLREEEVSWLLLAGFLTSTEAEMLAASRFDASQRDARSLSMEISLPFLRGELRSDRWALLSDLHDRLLQVERTASVNRFADQRREPGRWVDLAQTLLKQAGWPAGHRTDSALFQAIAKWERVLDEVALLDFDGRLISYPDFLRVLASHCEETLFAPESLGAPVQIMGALEASGQRFDALWFLGADDASWPLRGRMHPLLPYDVQKKTEMPHSTPEADFTLSRDVTLSLISSAPAVVISHAARNKDGELRPSPLIGLIAKNTAWETSPGWRAELNIPGEDHAPAEMEEIADASGVIAWPQEQSAGGSEVLARQAACPFQAFATKRLAAEQLNRSDWGLTAAERGNLLHKVLEKLWSPEFGHLHTLDDLLRARSEGRLHSIVEESIAEIFTEEFEATGNDDPWLNAYLASERRTLCRRIEDWLKVEAERVPFTVIACEEQLNDVSVSGLKLRLRADRIDEVPGHARLLIDYKTGLEVSTADWNPPRPAQPQLPLYAAFGNVEDVSGILFARLRAGETCFAGKVKDARALLSAELNNASSLVKYPYSDTERDQWAEALMELARDFLNGEAVVDPKDGRKTCEHCTLQGLCRVAERPAALETDDTESADA